MTQSIQQDQDQNQEKKKKPSRFDNVFVDALYNIIAWLPVTIISWIVSNFEF